MKANGANIRPEPPRVKAPRATIGRAMDEPLAPVARALASVEGLEPLACDGEGHPIEGAAACLHFRLHVASPRREVLLGTLGAVVRRARFVLAALVDRRDLYSLSFKPQKRGPTVSEAAHALAELLCDPDAFASDHVPDRRGR